MKSLQQRCEEYLREQLPELMELSFGCEIDVLVNEIGLESGYVGKYKLLSSNYETITVSGVKTKCLSLRKMCEGNDWKIIGHPIHLEHWLRVLAINKDGEIDVHSSKHLGEAHIAGISLYVQPDPDEDFIKFNLLTGQPTPESYQPLADLLGLSE